ncbi:MAG: 4Fe-4S binding protein [Peptococcaceae bacterium]|nr:4Fe-4S binding protein [Peptococcaceae bacterium]
MIKFSFKRLIVQFGAVLLANSHFSGFFDASIYQGSFKRICVPFMNCYSCPGAIGACPVGALQMFLAGPVHRLSFYVIGFLVAVGALAGRLVCGWLCPFGLLQDFLARPWARRVCLPVVLQNLKYIVLLLTITLPFFWLDQSGIGSPVFCKYLCPVGTLEAGLLLGLQVPSLRALMGTLFVWKLLVLVILLVLMLFIYRPFCRTLCPLGAFYSLFNNVSLWRLEHNPWACTKCYTCRDVCPLQIKVDVDPNNPECIRCLECVKACPAKALSFSPSKQASRSMALHK